MSVEYYLTEGVTKSKNDICYIDNKLAEQNSTKQNGLSKYYTLVKICGSEIKSSITRKKYGINSDLNIYQ